MAARLKSIPSPVSDERQRLALAISKRVALREQLAAVKAAADSAMRESMSLRGELESAQSRVSQAEERMATSHVERAMGRPPIRGETPNEARQVVANLTDQIEALQSARQHLVTQQADIERQASWAETEVKSALDSVLWGSAEVRRVLHDLETATKTRLELLNVLNEVGAVPNSMLKFTAINPPVTDELPAKWRSAISKLKEDADAKLPG